MAKSYVVTAALVVVKDGTGADRYLYRGMPVPADIPADRVSKLRELRMVAKAVQEPTATSAENKPPNKSAPAGDWTAYAISQGMPTEDAAKATKAELIEKYSAQAPATSTPASRPTQEPSTGDGGGGAGAGDNEVSGSPENS